MAFAFECVSRLWLRGVSGLGPGGWLRPRPRRRASDSATNDNTVSLAASHTPDSVKSSSSIPHRSV
eukprot:55222-Rhodomonas_salina.1